VLYNLHCFGGGGGGGEGSKGINKGEGQRAFVERCEIYITLQLQERTAESPSAELENDIITGNKPKMESPSASIVLTEYWENFDRLNAFEKEAKIILRISVFSLNAFSIIFISCVVAARYFLDGFLLPSIYQRRYLNLDDLVRRQICSQHLNLIGKILMMCITLWPVLSVNFLGGDWLDQFPGCSSWTLYDAHAISSVQIAAFKAFELLYLPDLRHIMFVHHLGVVLAVSNGWLWGTTTALLDISKLDEVKTTMKVTLIWGKSEIMFKFCVDAANTTTYEVLVDHFFDGVVCSIQIFRRMFPRRTTLLSGLFYTCFRINVLIATAESILIPYTIYRYRNSLPQTNQASILFMQLIFGVTKMTSCQKLLGISNRLQAARTKSI